MYERCRCGADLIADLPMCLHCGARRPEPRVLVGAGAAAAPTQWHPVIVRQVPHAPAPGFAPPAPFAPSRPSAAPWIVAGATIVVLAVVGALLVVLLRPVPTTGSTTVPTVPAPTSVTTVTAAPSPAPEAPSAGTTDRRGSTAALQAVVDASRSSAESLDELWVPQLSSKRSGTVDDGTTYDPSSIYTHYQELAAAHPGTLLLRSGDWSVYRESDYWVAVSGQGFSTAAAANAWCASEGFAADDCYAKRLSHTAGPSGTSVPRS